VDYRRCEDDSQCTGSLDPNGPIEYDVACVTGTCNLPPSNCVNGTQRVYNGNCDHIRVNGRPSEVCHYDFEPCEISGCTESTASNYDPSATTDDGSCSYEYLGCTDSSALNYDSNATSDDGSCSYALFGCIDGSAANYDPYALLDDGSCYYEDLYCSD
jgi:hypothetical protein